MDEHHKKEPSLQDTDDTTNDGPQIRPWELFLIVVIHCCYIVQNIRIATFLLISKTAFIQNSGCIAFDDVLKRLWCRVSAILY